MTINLNEVQIDPIFGRSSREIFSVLAKAHAFDLTALTTAEAHRLLAFIEIAEQEKYPEFSGWSEKVFVTAKMLCEQEVCTFVGQQPKGTRH